MSFTAANERIAQEIIAYFPKPKSALICLLHLAQEQDGYVTNDAMRQIASLTGTTPAEVKGTASFYEMFHFEPVGRYLVNICTNISCMLSGGKELLAHAQAHLGVRPGGSSSDGLFTLEEVECVAACTEAPCLQVNYRYRYRVTHSDFDDLISELRAGRLSDEIPAHGTLAQVRQSIPRDRLAGIRPPNQAREAPIWLSNNGSGNSHSSGSAGTGDSNGGAGTVNSDSNGDVDVNSDGSGNSHSSGDVNGNRDGNGGAGDRGGGVNDASYSRGTSSGSTGSGKSGLGSSGSVGSGSGGSGSVGSDSTGKTA